MSNTKSSNQTAVPEAKGALDRFKFEVANRMVLSEVIWSRK